MMMKSKFYVYAAYGVEGEVLYIGKGSGNRYQHCSSGCSHNKQLNRYYFSNGEGNCIRTEIIHQTDCESEAFEIEAKKIKSLLPTFNLSQSVDRVKPKGKNFKRDASLYYELYMESKNCVDNDAKINLEGKMIEIQENNTDFAEILDVIGIDAIKSTDFHKTKSKLKCDNKLIKDSSCLEDTSMLRGLEFELGIFYSYNQIKKEIQKHYDLIGVKSKAKATEIAKIFNVKRTARGGVEGFMIISKTN